MKKSATARLGTRFPDLPLYSGFNHPGRINSALSILHRLAHVPGKPRGWKRWSRYMPPLCRSVALGAAFLGGIAIGANADPLCRDDAASCQPPARELAALSPANTVPPARSVTLPNVDIFGGKLNPHPYSSPGVGPRVSSFGTVRAEHYEVPADFDTNVASHPYTSGVGPWPGPGTAGTSLAGSKPPSHHYRKSLSLTMPAPSSGTQ